MDSHMPPWGRVCPMRRRAKEEAKQRLARMEGQVRGLVNMIEGDREFIDVLTQVAALRAALEGLGSLVLTQHVEEIIASTASPTRDETVQDRVEQVREALARFVK